MPRLPRSRPAWHSGHQGPGLIRRGRHSIGAVYECVPGPGLVPVASRGIPGQGTHPTAPQWCHVWYKNINYTTVLRRQRWCTRGGGRRGERLPPPRPTQPQHARKTTHAHTNAHTHTYTHTSCTTALAPIFLFCLEWPPGRNVPGEVEGSWPHSRLGKHDIAAGGIALRGAS